MAERLPRTPQPLPLIAVRRGQHIVRQGEPSHGLWLIHGGAMITVAVSPEGHALGLDVLGPGDVVGEPDDAASPVDVRALELCRLRPVPASKVCDQISARARRSARLAKDLAWLPVDTRIRCRLTDLAERFGSPAIGGTAVGLTLTQDELAALAGTTRESANRALHRLMDQGHVAVLRRGRYLVCATLRPLIG